MDPFVFNHDGYMQITNHTLMPTLMQIKLPFIIRIQIFLANGNYFSLLSRSGDVLCYNIISVMSAFHDPQTIIKKT